MFRFKQFTIHQDRTPMKVGTDGVVLGAWAAVDGSVRRVLDIGTGTGLIALMMAQRCPDAVVDSVEIDEASAEQAAENFEASPWSDRVAVCQCDINDYCIDERYDLILSNPPYFVDSLQCPDRGRSAARHTASLPFSDLIESVVRLLESDGRFALILPCREAELFDAECEGRLFLTRRCDLHSRIGGDVKRLLSEYQLTPCIDDIMRESLTIEREQHLDYCEEYRELTRDFYLKF